MADVRSLHESGETTERWWPDPKEGPWLLRLHWERRKGRPEPVGMVLQLAPGSSKSSMMALTTSLLRDVKIAEIAAQEREKLPFEEPEPPSSEELVAGMRPQTVEKLKRAAAVYRQAWQAGENPVKAVEKALRTSHASANSYVRRARAAGFLPQTEQGRPAG